MAVKYSPDETMLYTLTSEGDDPTTILGFDPNTGNLIKGVKVNQGPTTYSRSIAVDHNHRVYYAYERSDGKIRIW